MKQVKSICVNLLNTKALDSTGEFEGLGSTFGNIDLDGEIIEPGAFKRALKKRGGKIKVFYGHNYYTTALS